MKNKLNDCNIYRPITQQQQFHLKEEEKKNSEKIEGPWS